MFTALYFLGLGVTLLAFPAWLVASCLVGRLRAAPTMRRLRWGAGVALVMVMLGVLLGAFYLALVLGGVVAFGPRLMAARLYVVAPPVLVALSGLVWWGIPALWRTVRAVGAAGDPVPAAAGRTAAEPCLVVPVQVNLVVSVVVLYLGWFSPPTSPWWSSALLWWTVLALVAALLVVRQGRLRDGTGGRRGLLWRLARGVAVIAALAVAVTGCSAWAARSSRLADRHVLGAHGSYDFGGGPAVAGLPGGLPGRHGHHRVPRPETSVDDLAEKDLSGPVRRYVLTARTARIALSSGAVINAWTFNGKIPGPQLRVRQGDLVEVTLVNADLKAGVTLHWHGYDVPNSVDGAAGVTQNSVMPGQRYLYRFRARQAGTYWYHSHQQSAEQVRRGLFGALIVEPATGPTDKVDIAVTAHTWDKAANPTRPKTFDAADRPQHRRIVPGTPVRLRLINTDGKPRSLAVTGTPYRVAAIDGAELSGPGQIRGKQLPLAGGGRYDLTFTMPDHPAAVTTATADGAVKPDRPGLVLSPDGRSLPAAEPPGGTFDPASYGTPAATPFGQGTRYDRHFTLDLDNAMGYFDGRLVIRYRVNARVFPNIPTLVVRPGEVIKTTFVNRSYQDHPMHLHGHHMLVLSRNSRPVSGSPWWTDTLNVGPGQTYDVAFKADNPGVWMDHCHNLDHAAAGMMLHLTYDRVRSPYQTGRATPNHPE